MRGDNSPGSSDGVRERSLSMESVSSDSEGGSGIVLSSSAIGVEVERGAVGGALVIPRLGYIHSAPSRDHVRITHACV
jgi:hypothetical protein